MNSRLESAPPRTLAVVDWALDPHAVAGALARRAEPWKPAFGLVVPAWLHGLDWVGDPTAAFPCARRQLGDLARLCPAAGIEVGLLAVGDPDPVTATGDALRAWPADEIVLCARSRHFAAPPVLGLASRLARLTGLRVVRLRATARQGGLAAGRSRCAPVAT